MIPKTEKELEEWMKDNCYNFRSYSIGGNPIGEGYGIENSGGLYIWYYTERGERENLKYFMNEEDVIKFAFNEMKTDKWANSHCIGFTDNKERSIELVEILTQMKIKYMIDEIPYYSINKPTHRVFVFGCDKLKTKNLKEIYFEKK